MVISVYHTTMNLIETLGSALYETHGELCEELIKAGYDLDNYYDGGRRWGNFDRVLVMVAVIRGATSYYEYEVAFNKLKRDGDTMVIPRLFARLTGIKAKTQTERTNRYRANQSAELAELRALRWIDEHPVDAIQYIRDKFSKLL